MWSDPIADMLTRVRNAVKVRQQQVLMPCSKLKEGVARVLKEEGFINGFDLIDDGQQKLLRIDLKYGSRGEDVIHVIRRVSKPGRRIYAGVEQLPRVLNGMGIAIVSTSSGVMSDRQCRAKNLGGELLGTIY
ncbi:MAG: 30S ribosomal protein S8 [Phycisphaerae bacterium]|nr:30S ribosomal protein S8 [Phycisphaerae bacterium]